MGVVINSVIFPKSYFSSHQGSGIRVFHIVTVFKHIDYNCTMNIKVLWAISNNTMHPNATHFIILMSFLFLQLFIVSTLKLLCNAKL